MKDNIIFVNLYKIILIIKIKNILLFKLIMIKNLKIIIKIIFSKILYKLNVFNNK